MPTYVYACAKCGHEFEFFQSMKDKPLTVCPSEKCKLKKWGKGRVKKPSDLMQHRLLHIETRDDWRLWFAGQGIEIDWKRGPLLVDTAIGVQAAVAGKGVLLGRPSLIGDELAAERLVAPLPQGLSKGMAYHLVYLPENMAQPAVRAFRAWLLETVGRDGTVVAPNRRSS